MSKFTEDQITSFKSLLKEGIVKFEFDKKDGSRRVAFGTTKSELCPKTVRLNTYDCTAIEWNTDGIEDTKISAKLPTKVKAKIPADTPECDIQTALREALTRKYGISLKSFSYSKLDTPKRTLPEGMIFFADMERGGYRSFNADQLISWEPDVKQSMAEF